MRRLIVVLGAIAAAIGVAAVASRRLFRSREDTKWEDAERPGRIITVDGVGLHIVEKAPPIGADAPAIVMVHGFGGHTYSFRHQLSDLSQDYRCVAIDLKGFGYSVRPDGGDYSLTEHARLVLRVMDELGIEKATLIGHSMGGEVVMRMAETAPERAERLVLVASVPARKLPVAPRWSIMRPFLGPTLRLIAIRSWGRLFYNPSKLPLAEIRREYLKPGRIYGSTNTVWEMWRDIRHDRQVDYRRLTLPVLLLWAEKDRILPFPGQALRWLQKKLPHARTEHIPLAGHLLLEEQPDACNRALRRFLEGERVAERAPSEAEARVASVQRHS